MSDEPKSVADTATQLDMMTDTRTDVLDAGEILLLRVAAEEIRRLTPASGSGGGTPGSTAAETFQQRPFFNPEQPPVNIEKFHTLFGDLGQLEASLKQLREELGRLGLVSLY